MGLKIVNLGVQGRNLLGPKHASPDSEWDPVLLFNEGPTWVWRSETVDLEL